MGKNGDLGGKLYMSTFLTFTGTPPLIAHMYSLLSHPSLDGTQQFTVTSQPVGLIWTLRDMAWHSRKYILPHSSMYSQKVHRLHSSPTFTFPMQWLHSEKFKMNRNGNSHGPHNSEA